jgi:proteasome lid subunit RPN8/RPN11
VNDLTSLLQPNQPNEICGLVVKGQIVELDNIHPEPTKGFRMEPIELLHYIEDATASWHTHPDSDPGLSEEDYAGFTQWPKLVHHIIGVRAGVTTVETYDIIDGLVIKR